MDYAGYHFDGGENFNTWRSNSYCQRRDIFRADTGKFTGKPRTFIGPLYHDLMSCGTGVPPDKFIYVLTSKFLSKFLQRSCFSARLLNRGYRVRDSVWATNFFVFCILGVEIKIQLTMNEPMKMIDYFRTVAEPDPIRSYKIKLDRIGN